MAELRRLAELSGKKADALIARRARREKARVLRAWRRLHVKRTLRRQASNADEAGTLEASGKRETTAGSRTGASNRGWRRETGSSSPSSTSASSFSGSSTSRSSSSTVSSLSSGKYVDDIAASPAKRSSLLSPQPSFPVPSAAEAARAGNANTRVCFRNEIDRTNRDTARACFRDGTCRKVVKPSTKCAAEIIHEAMFGDRVGQSFYTREMRALARFQWYRKTHEENNIRAIFNR